MNTNLAKRSLSFVIGIPLLAGAFALNYYVSDRILLIVLWAALLVGTSESTRIVGLKGSSLAHIAIVFVTMLCMAAHTLLWTAHPSAIAIIASSLILMVCIFAGICLVVMYSPSAKDSTYESALSDISRFLFAILYPGLMGLACITILSPVFSRLPTEHFIYFLAMVFANDTFAYLTGMLWGGSTRGIFPASPKKSLVGVLGGLLATIIVAKLGASYILGIAAPLLMILLLGTVVAVLGVLGDLFESILKRSAGIKDSGNLLPGMGGALDRLDSILFCACGYVFIMSIILKGLSA